MKISNNRLTEYLLVFVIYLILAIIVTFPFILHFSSSVWGYMGDNWGSIWQAWWEKSAFLGHFDYHHSFLVGYPWGTDVALGGVKEWFWWGPVKVLTLAVNEVFAFNLVSFLSFPLAGLTMFALVKHILSRVKDANPRIGNYAPAFLAGAVFTFCPYHFWQSYTHIALGQIQYLPLFFLAMLFFFEKPSLKRGLLWGFSFAAVVYSSFYYAYFIVLVSPLLVAYLVFKGVMGFKGGIKSYGREIVFGLVGFGLVAAVSLLPIYFSVYKGQFAGAAGNTMQRSIQDLLSLSSRPWDFFIPAPDHFLWGQLGYKIYSWILPHSMDFKTISAYLPERVLYLGFVPVILAVAGLIWGLRGTKGIRGMAGFFAILGFLAFIFSLPPFIYFKAHKIYFPTYFLYQYLLMFRVYARMGILVVLPVAVLAGVGLQELLRGKKAKNIIVITIVTFITLIEFQGKPWANTTKIDDLKSIEPAYAWLMTQPGDDAIVEYPIEYDTQEALFFQRFHQRPIFNMLGEPKQYVLWKKLSNLTDPEVPGILSSLAIKYVVWHHTDTLYHLGNPVDEPRYRKFAAPPLSQDTGELRLVYTGADAYIYEITAKPSFASYEAVWEKFVK